MNDLVEILRDLTETQLLWKFYYGRNDFNNLVETNSENDPKNYFFLDPVNRNPIYSDIGLPTGEIDCEGHFMILTKSKLDEVYDGQKDNPINNGRWLKYIKPKIDFIYSDFQKKLNCVSNLTIAKMSSTEIINMFDENMDGILVNYKFRITK